MRLPLVVVTVMVALLLLLLLHSKATHRGNTSPSKAQAATHPKKVHARQNRRWLSRLPH